MTSLPEEGQMQWAEPLNEYLEAAAAIIVDAATEEVDAAVAAAEAAAAAAEAVGNSNDTIIASRLNDPASAASSKLALAIRTLDRLRSDVRAGSITATAPLLATGDSHTDLVTAAQYFWQQLWTYRNRVGEGLEGIAQAAFLIKGKNGSTLRAYLDAHAQAGGLDEGLAANPYAAIHCWLVNDTRLGGLGLTVAAIRAAGKALLEELLAYIYASGHRPRFNIFRVPAPFTTVDGGEHYVRESASGPINPAGLAQTYTDGIRAAYYDFAEAHPEVLIYDPQTRLFGTTCPTSNDGTNGLFNDQIHQSQRGYWAEADDFAEWVAAALPRAEGRASEARRTTPATPWTAYSRELEDATRYALVAESAIAEDGADTRTFIRFGPSVPSAIPGNIRADDVIEFIANGKAAVIPSGSTISANGANTQVSFGSGATLASLGVGAVKYLDRVRVYRRSRGSDDTVNRVAADKSNTFRRVGRVSGGGTSFVDVGAVSFSADPPILTAGDWVPTINPGDLLYVEGVAAPITLTSGGGTGAFSANGPTLRVSNLSGLSLDFSTMVGKMIAIVGTHRDVGTGTLTNTVAASGAAQTLLDTAAGYGLHVLTLTANCTLTFPKAVIGKTFEVVLVQDGTGSRTVTWPSSFPAVRWAGGTAPTLTTTAAKADWLRFRCHDGVNWLGELVGQNY